MKRNLKVIRAILEYVEDTATDSGGALRPDPSDLPPEAPIHPVRARALEVHARLCVDAGLLIETSKDYYSLTWKGHDWLEERRRLTGAVLLAKTAAAVESTAPNPPEETATGGSEDLKTDAAPIGAPQPGETE